MHTLVPLFLLFSPLAPPPAKPAAAPATKPVVVEHLGRFRGSIEIPSTPLEIEVTLEVKSGNTGGFISIPAQKVRDMKLADVKASPAGVSFAMPGIPGDPRFQGQAAGGVIKGTFTQGQGAFPFTLKRLNPRDEADAALKGLDAAVEQALKDFNVPGVALGVVKDGEVVLLKGYGQRDVEKKLPVTPRTLFAIGSTTKAFTTVVMQQLVEEGKLDWNTPVRTYLPSFAMKDDNASALMTPRDLVTHVSGLPRHDLVWYNNLPLSRDDVVQRLRYLEPNKSFRQEWQYNNLMFMTAGFLVEKVSGRSWEANVRDRILVPLKMTRTNFTVKDAARDPDHAEPYKEHKDALTHVPFRDITTAGPAGSINSCVEEMARWMLMHLEGGSVDGKRVLQGTSLTELHAPRATVPGSSDDPAVLLPSYASGWLVDAYRGQRRVHHGGGIDGFITQVALFPDSHLGIVVFANSSSTGLPSTLANVVADRMLSLGPRDWLREASEKRARGKGLQKEAEGNKNASQVKDTHPSRALDELAGHYSHPGYGPLDVVLKDGVLTATYNGIRLPLQHWHYDVFRSAEQKEEPDFEGLLFNFRSNDMGEIEAVDVPLEPSVAAIHFARQPDPRLSDPAFLSALTGDYDLKGRTLRIELRTQVLVLSQDGGPPLELVPARGVGFTLKGIHGVRLEFVMDKAGKSSSEMRLVDPSGAITLPRKPAAN